MPSSNAVDYPTLLSNSHQPNLQSPQSLGYCLVTGAAGFLGRNIVRTLLAQGCKVRALINRTPLGFTHENLDIFPGSITDPSAMQQACEGIDTIFHSAAVIALMGGSYVTQDYYKKAYKTNVEGTQNLLDAATNNNVRRFIHTSSVDVCFDYTEQSAMKKDTPYSKNPRSVYQQTKILAEKAVLSYNGKNGLFTCAIRPGGIFGAEENEVVDRFLEQLLAGRLLMRIGNGSSRMDNSYIGNLVHGEILAALHLCESGPANGKAYFINDNEPMNSFEFFRPLIEGLGYKMPALYLPGSLLVPFLKIVEFIALKLNLNEPAILPHAIYKVSVSHYGCTESAKKDIGYTPLKTVAEAMAETLTYCQEKIKKSKSNEQPKPLTK